MFYLSFFSIFAINFYHVHYLTNENNDRLKGDFDNLFCCNMPRNFCALEATKVLLAIIG